MHTPKIDMHIYLQAKFTPLSKLKPACQQTVHYCISARQLLSAIEHTIQSVEIPLTLRHATEWFEVQRNKPINLSRQMYTCTCIISMYTVRVYVALSTKASTHVLTLLGQSVLQPSEL